MRPINYSDELETKQYVEQQRYVQETDINNNLDIQLSVQGVLISRVIFIRKGRNQKIGEPN